MKRRNFIKGLLGLSAVPVIAKAGIVDGRVIEITVAPANDGVNRAFVEKLVSEIEKSQYSVIAEHEIDKESPIKGAASIGGVEIADISDFSVST